MLSIQSLPILLDKVGGSTTTVKPTKTLNEEPFIPQQMESGCEEIARMVQEEIGGYLYKVASDAPSLGPVYEGIVIKWNYHVVVIKDGIVYDGLKLGLMVCQKNYTE